MPFQMTTRILAVARVETTVLVNCHWPWRSSNVDDLHFISKGVWHFLLLINSNLGPILHRLATIHPLQIDGRRTTMKKGPTFKLTA